MINPQILQRAAILLVVIAGEAFADEPRSAVLQGIRLIDGMVGEDQSTPHGFLPVERRERPVVFEFSELGFATVDDADQPMTGPPPVPPQEASPSPEPDVLEPEPLLTIEPARQAADPAPHPPVLPPVIADPRYQSSALPSYYQHGCHTTYAPLGEYLHTAFARQAHRGSAALMTLYGYDFYPAGTDREAELTPRGRRQLQSFVRRMQFTPAPIKLEGSYDNDELDAARQAHVANWLAAQGIADDASYVVIVNPQTGFSGLEGTQIGGGLIEMVRSRGRTIRGDSSSTFSGNAVFGQ